MEKGRDTSLIRELAALSSREKTAVFCFFLSGFCGLSFEICWIKKASLVFGSTLYAMSTVVAVFFAGLAIGSYYFGKVSTRHGNPLKLYGQLEGIVGILVLATIPLLSLLNYVYGHVYETVAGSPVSLALTRLLLIAVVLLPPTILMGATLPLFCRHFVRRRNAISIFVSFLYGVNTLGAMLGSLMAGFLLMPVLGLNTTIGLSGLVLVSVGVLNFKLFFSPASESGPGAPAKQESAGAGGTTVRRSRLDPGIKTILVFALFFCAGFVALGNEILWTRYLSLIVHNTVYTVAVTLAVILSGIAFGSFLVAKTDSAISNTPLVFSFVHMAIGLIVLIAMMIPASFWQFVVDTQNVAVQLSVAASIFFIPSVLSGISFPLAVKMVSRHESRVGERVGAMSALSTVGGIAGSLGLAFLILPSLGIQRSIYITTGASVGIGILALLFLEEKKRKVHKIVVAASAVLIWILIPIVTSTELPGDFLGQTGRLVEYREGLNSNLAVVESSSGQITMEIDRLWQGEKTKNHQIMAAHIPMVHHRGAEDVLMVGVGVGQTAQSFLYHPIRQLVSVDIEREIYELIGKYFFNKWMSDERVSIVTEDGRNYISHTSRKFDIVSIEVGQIFRPGCAAFYTREFYTDVKNRLKKDGIVSQFVPLAFLRKAELHAVIRTFMDIFPSSVLWFNSDEFLLLGSADRQPVLKEKQLDALGAREKVRKDLDMSYWGGAKNHLNRRDVFAAGFLMGPESLKEMVSGADVYVDDRPKLAYAAAQRQKYEGREVEALITGLIGYLDSPALILENLPTDSTLKKIAQKRKLNLRNIAATDLVEQYFVDSDVAHLLQAYARNPMNISVLSLLGTHYFKEGTYPKATNYLLEIVRLDRTYTNAHILLGSIYNRSRQYERAVYHYREALKFPGDKAADLHNDLGVVYAGMGNFKTALSHFEAALSIDPEFEKAERNVKKARLALDRPQF